MRSVIAFLSLVAWMQTASSQQVPPVKLEAFAPKGFRASIPDAPGIELFGFHGKKNAPIGMSEEGEFSMDILKPVNNFWVFNDPELTLQVGDEIHYWVFVQHRKLGYRKDNQKWIVPELLSQSELHCSTSTTTVNGNNMICKETIIFEDYFQNLDESQWVIESYIPNSGPNFEFNSYENSRNTIKVVNQKLRITPVAKESESELRGVLDLTAGCTSKFPKDCYHKQEAAYFLPPVKSGKIRSKISFKYGRIDVRAKLPSGDWLFPDISLVPIDRSSHDVKIIVAYSRGNEHLTGNDGIDIGGNLLFSGPIVSASEPTRSLHLRSKRHDRPFNSEVHTYSIIWKPDKIISLIDNVEFGKVTIIDEINDMEHREALNKEFYLTIGVGVGGNNDFPDYYKSGSNVKPWINRDRRSVKTFFDARNLWLQTWRGDNVDLVVEFVKVFSL